MANCENCIHYDVCKKKYYHLHESYSVLDSENIENVCMSFKDKNSFIELPCKVGDTVYLVTNEIQARNVEDLAVERLYNKNDNGICKLTVFEFAVRDVAAVKFNETAYTFAIGFDQIGKILFIGENAREEAEKALKECESNDR